MLKRVGTNSAPFILAQSSIAHPIVGFRKMHILLTNDDGPPDVHSSPYIHTFYRVLTSPPFNHTVSVILPSTQRSWIGKAHLLPPHAHSLAGASNRKSNANEVINDVLTPIYYDPVEQKEFETPPWKDGSNRKDYWVLIPGTPATCTQLGLFHHALLFPHFYSNSQPNQESPSTMAPIDLVLSGPNLGRNTTAAFALSSGTLGGALEGAVCGVRAIALSFAFFTRKEPPELIEEASAHACRVVEALCQKWDSNPPKDDHDKSVPDVYTVNVPLVDDVSKHKVMWTWMLDNKWRSGSLYRAIPPADAEKDSAKIDSAAADGIQKDVKNSAAQAHETGNVCFKWSPAFTDIWKTIEASPRGNDGLAMRQGVTSITPLKANFEGLYGRDGFEGELKL